MSTDSAASDPVRSRARQALAVTQQLQQEVRADRRHPAAVSLLVMGVLWTLAGVVYRVFPAVGPQVVPDSGGGYRIPNADVWANLGGEPPHVAAAWFWILATPTAWALCGWLFHRRHGRGLGPTGGLIAGIGVLPFLLLVTVEAAVAPHVDAVHRLLDNPANSTINKQAVAVAVGLVLVAVRERHVWLGVAAGVFAVVPWWACGRLAPGQAAWLSGTAWGHELLDANLALLWWGLATTTVAAAWWASRLGPTTDRLHPSAARS